MSDKVLPGIPTIKGKRLGGKHMIGFLVPVLTVEHSLITDKDDPLYDPRASWGIHRPTVDSIKRFGIDEPIKCVKRGKTEDNEGNSVDTLATYNGNQRIINGCQAQRELIEEMGESAPTIKIEVKLFTGSESEVYARKGLSFIRRNNDSLNEAIMMAKHYALSQDYEDVSLAFGCSVKHVKRQLELASAPKAVHEEINKGTLSATEAREEYAKLSTPKAIEKLKANKVSERASVNNTNKRTRRKTKSEGATKAPNKKTIKSFCKQVLSWAEGQTELNKSEEWKENAFFSFQDYASTLAWLTGQLTKEQACEKSSLLSEFLLEAVEGGEKIKAKLEKKKASSAWLERVKVDFPIGARFFKQHRKALREAEVREIDPKKKRIKIFMRSANGSAMISWVESKDLLTSASGEFVPIDKAVELEQV